MFVSLCVVQVAAAVDRGSPDFMTGLRVSRRELQLSARTQAFPLAGTRALPGRAGARNDKLHDAVLEHTALSTFDIDIPINFLFYGAHTPAAQPTARARAMFTRAFVLRAVLFCAALRRAALAEGWGGSSAADGP